MNELTSEIKGKSFQDGENITIALKTYLDENKNCIYKVLVVNNNQLIDESEEFSDHTKAKAFFLAKQTEYHV